MTFPWRHAWQRLLLSTFSANVNVRCCNSHWMPVGQKQYCWVWTVQMLSNRAGDVCQWQWKKNSHQLLCTSLNLRNFENVSCDIPGEHFLYRPTYTSQNITENIKLKLIVNHAPLWVQYREMTIWDFSRTFAWQLRTQNQFLVTNLFRQLIPSDLDPTSIYNYKTKLAKDFKL